MIPRLFLQDSNFVKIQKTIDDHPESQKKLSYDIIQMIQDNHLENETIFNEIYEDYRTIDFLYDILKNSLLSRKLTSINKLNDSMNKPKIPDITSDFYNGFGNELLQT